MARQKRNNCERSPRFIPPELVREIVSLLGPAELFSVGLLNRIFQAEADRLIYHSIGSSIVRSRTSDSLRLRKFLSCLDTIATVKSKAVLVKSLAIYVDPTQGPATSDIVQHLCLSLPNMTSLTHLQLRIFPKSSMERDLMRVLQRSTFSLTTFYPSQNLIYRYFFLKQPSLKSLIFDCDHYLLVSNAYEAIIDRIPPENKLSLFGFGYPGEKIYSITSFPVFSQDWSAATIKEAIGLFKLPSEISTFQLYILTLSDEVCLRQYARSISDNFGRVLNLSLFVADSRIHTNPDGLASALSYLSDLQILSIHISPLISSSFDSFQKDRVDLARRWSAGCPILDCIYFPDGSCCDLRDGVWGLSG